MLIGSIHWISFAFTGIHWHEAALIRHHPNSLAFIHILTLIHILHTLTFIDIHWQSLTIIGIRWYWLRNSVVFFSIHQASSEFIGNHDIHWHWSCISWNNWHLWAFIRHHLHSLAFTITILKTPPGRECFSTCLEWAAWREAPRTSATRWGRRRWPGRWPTSTRCWKQN